MMHEPDVGCVLFVLIKGWAVLEMELTLCGCIVSNIDSALLASKSCLVHWPFTWCRLLDCLVVSSLGYCYVCWVWLGMGYGWLLGPLLWLVD